MIETPLFDAQTIYWSAVDLEIDSASLARWTTDLEIARRFMTLPARPFSSEEMKKYLEKRLKQAEEGGQEFYFAARMKAEVDLAGFVTIKTQMWNHGVARLDIVVDPYRRPSTVLRESLDLALVYIFEELNLFRIDVTLPEFDYEAVEVYEQAGFVLEVRSREAVYRAEHYWDLLHYGFLRSEWHGQADPVDGVVQVQAGEEI
jgi:RimJ/RimL family protein N-acetyltransferase